MKLTSIILFVLLVSVALGGLALGRMLSFLPGTQDDKLHNPKAAPRAVTPRGELDAEETRTIELFRKVAPSVVFINKFGVRYNIFSRDPVQVRESEGSGFVWSEDGYIVTNRHVIGDITNESEWRVTFADNHTTLSAKIVGIAPEKDLAVLKVDTEMKLTPIEIGTSADLLVGQKVFAIGNPFGLDQTLTKGIISALHREINSQVRGRNISDVIQTDAAINPGNSGGPLIDSSGRLIGVTTAIQTLSGASNGIAFAVPVDTVNSIVPQLIKYGYVVRPGLGVIPADDDRSRWFGVKTGVLVADVAPGSGADDVGLRPAQVVETRQGYRLRRADVILAIDDQAITNNNDLYRVLERKKAGDVVKVTIERDAKEKLDVKIKLQELKAK
ncbi:MAG: S1C family serine protease [Planctomycetota bacterium]